MRTLLIDDFRKINADVVARTYEEGLSFLQSEHWDRVYLDNDLGSSVGKDGYSLACFMEEHPEHRPGEVVIVSSNPVGRQNIERCLSNFCTRVGVGTWRVNPT